MELQQSDGEVVSTHELEALVLSCLSYTIVQECFMKLYVGELIVSKYVAESINNWLQNISATKLF